MEVDSRVTGMATSKWLNLRVKVPAKDLDAVRSKIRGWPEEVAREVYWPALQQIAANGAEYIRFIILASDTKTGEKRVAAGGPGPGRVDTGEMFDNVGYRNRVTAGGFSSFVGWINGRPGYAIFQELGTQGGIKAMNAIGQAQEYMLSEIRALAKGQYTGSPIGYEEGE